MSNSNTSSAVPKLASVPPRSLEIDYFYTQANVTNQPMGIVTATTIGDKNRHLVDTMFETTVGILVTNSKGSLLVPWTNIRNVVYK